MILPPRWFWILVSVWAAFLVLAMLHGAYNAHLTGCYLQDDCAANPMPGTFGNAALFFTLLTGSSLLLSAIVLFVAWSVWVAVVFAVQLSIAILCWARVRP